MKFNKIYLPEQITLTKGIKEIELNNLGNVVALVGKNGSGKTRILDLMEEQLMNSITLSRVFDGSISYMSDQFNFIKSQLMRFKDYYLILEKTQKLSIQIKNEPSNNRIKEEHQILSRQLQTGVARPTAQDNQFAQQIINAIDNAKKNNLRRIKNNEIRALQQAIGKIDESISFEKLIEKIDQKVNYNEFNSISKSGLQFLAKLPHKLTSDKISSLLDNSVFEDKVSYKRFLSLKSFIESFLKKEFTWQPSKNDGNLSEHGHIVTHTGIWKIDNRIFDYDEFSDGEKTLFAYALLFFLLEQNPNLSIKESIILVDEPELHLHPDSEIELMDRMREIVGNNGQLIFATHSINILSHLSYDEIFIVKKNCIEKKNSLTPKQSLNELMQLENRVSKLSEFIDSIESWTYSNFMAQCFSDPEVIESSMKNDPQVEALKKAIKDNSNQERNLLLDFGAGKGRLIEQIKSDYSFSDNLSYSTLEPETSFHLRLKELGVNQIYEDHNSLPQSSFDFIVLCNVLHEIKLESWIEVINKTIEALKENGFLIIIEAKRLNKGEKIGKTGYLLLGIDEMQILFGIENTPSSLKNNENKITCGIFPKSQLNPISKKNLINCFNALSVKTLEKIEKLRSEDVPQNKLTEYGRDAAFLSQQYINSLLAIKVLTDKTKKDKGSIIEN